MTEQEATRKPDWPICRTGGCIGVCRDSQEACLAHVASQTRNTILAALKPGVDLDLRGTPIDRELLSQLLAAIRPQDGPPTLGDARFDRAKFSGHAEFKGARFSGIAEFREAQFSGDAHFDQAQFSENAWFLEAQFSGDTSFEAAQFSGDTRFEAAQFSGHAGFYEAQFSRTAAFHWAQFSGLAGFRGSQFSGTAGFRWAQFSGFATFYKAQFSRDAGFRGVQFSGTAGFSKAEFSGLAGFRGARFSGDARFNEAQFSGDATFNEAQFSGAASFDGAQFKRAGSFGPVLAASHLILDRATFEQDIVIEAVGGRLSCEGTRFAEAATLRLRRAQVVLDGALFAKPSTIAFAPDPFKHHDPPTGGEVETFDESPVARVADSRSPRPQLLSLRGVDVATLTLSELDLAACLFQGTHHLDQLRIEGDRPFGDTPAAWRLHLGRWWVPVWRRWSRRHTLAEEHHWRSQHPSPAVPGRWSRLAQPAWHGPACQTPPWVAEQTGQRVQQLKPNRLAVLYRALRKAQEDSKDEPGAADFYYGEMEMRRRNRGRPLGERVILWLYWLVSGYGLRGLRALTCLVAVIVALAGLLQAIGFNGGDPGFRDALIYAAESTISIASGNKALTEHVSWAGEALRISLRLVGPVLLGLALLSVRNRVKR
jgi:Pentapeptide repeats (9 copies)